MQESIPTPQAPSAGVKGLSTDERLRLREDFAETGYAIIRGVVSKEKLSHLHGTILEAYEGARASGNLLRVGGALTGHLNCFPGQESRFAYTALQESGIVDLIGEIFPGKTSKVNVGCNLNLPKSVVQHYHVDSAFLEAYMVANVAVVDTDVENGAIDVVPGTTRKFYKYWRFAVERPQRHAARLPLHPGDVLLRSSVLWHRGMPNRTASPRPMLAFTFGDKGLAGEDPFQRNDGKIMFYENWYKETPLGRLRERAYLAAPFTYSTYRFVRSLFGTKGYATP